jgi:hypothetical protein
VSINERRIRTLQALVAGSVVAAAPDHNDIQSEFNEVYQVRKVPQLARRRLLQVLHSSRALDTFLAVFINHHGINPNVSSLGGYLAALTNHTVNAISRLPNTDRSRYQTNIVVRRNHYMHRAGAFPNYDPEVLTLLADIETCITQVISL